MGETLQIVKLCQLKPGNNDRTIFKAEALDELAQSIRENGLIQPISVREILAWEDNGTCTICAEVPAACKCVHYEVIAGERRSKAAAIAGLTSVQVILHDVTAEEASAMMLAENVARADLDVCDEANAYQARIDRYGWSVKQVADRAGVTSGRVISRIKLLRLHPHLQDLLRKNSFPLGYAQILAEASLDHNRQFRCIDKLNSMASPTPGWFRKLVGALSAEQTQQSMFDGDCFDGNESDALLVNESTPPDPAITAPPTMGNTSREIVSSQISFWLQAAKSWADLGQTFKRKECVAAAMALQRVLPYVQA